VTLHDDQFERDLARAKEESLKAPGLELFSPPPVPGSTREVGSTSGRTEYDRLCSPALPLMSALLAKFIEWHLWDSFLHTAVVMPKSVFLLYLSANLSGVAAVS
jgi:hypothetical protein